MRDFLNYLSTLNISKKSLKNYKSDINHFTSWIVLKARSFGSYIENIDQATPFLSTSVGNEYKSYLIKNHIPRMTINRRLSTLRHYAKFLKENRQLNDNFMFEIQNIGIQNTAKPIAILPLVEQFKAHLMAEKISSGTIKNYISDIKQFVSWFDKNPTHAQSK